MIGCYLFNGSFEEQKFGGLSKIISAIEGNRKTLWQIPRMGIIEILNQLSKEIVKDPDLRNIAGISFLSMWLKRNNLKDLVRTNFVDGNMEGFSKAKKNHLIKAQPRGIVCHWIAGNVPTIAAFSLFQSMLAKNGNILRVPKSSIEPFLKILKKLNDVKAIYEGAELKGSDLVKATSVIYFDSSDKKSNTMLSLAADCKVVWGGKQAVESIVALPQREWCETVIFGPKYSFGVVDRETIKSEEFSEVLEAFSRDIIAFDQTACSSPHVIFFEKNEKNIEDITKIFSKMLMRVSDKYPKTQLDHFIASKIINKRAEYYLDTKKDIIAPRELDWTILVDNNITLEEPIQSRTIFIKEVKSIFEVIPLITKKVQTIGLAVQDMETKKRFSDLATYRGVARCVKPGMMNDYETPWDGVLFLNRLVRWCSIVG
jgi:hypothetical protein